MKIILSLVWLSIYLIGCTAKNGLKVTESVLPHIETSSIHTITTTYTSTFTPSQTATTKPSPTTTPTPSPTLTPTSTPSPTPTGGGEQLLISLSRPAYRSIFPELQGDYRLFTVNLDGTELTALTTLDKSDWLQNDMGGLSISPDGQYLLIITDASRWSDICSLYVVKRDGTVLMKISDVIESSIQSAIWLKDGRIAYIAKELGYFYIFVSNPDGTGIVKITREPAEKEKSPYELLGEDGTRIYWYSGYETSTSINTSEVRWTMLDGSDEQALPFTQQNGIIMITFLPDWEHMVWKDLGLVDDVWVMGVSMEHTYFGGIDGTIEREIVFEEEKVSRWILSPDGSKLYMYICPVLNRNLKFGDCNGKIWLPSNFSFTDAIITQNYFQAWSPDSKLIVTRNDEEYIVTNLETMESQSLFSKNEYLNTLQDPSSNIRPSLSISAWLPGQR